MVPLFAYIIHHSLPHVHAVSRKQNGWTQMVIMASVNDMCCMWIPWLFHPGSWALLSGSNPLRHCKTTCHAVTLFHLNMFAKLNILIELLVQYQPLLLQSSSGNLWVVSKTAGSTYVIVLFAIFWQETNICCKFVKENSKDIPIEPCIWTCTFLKCTHVWCKISCC